MKNLLLIFFICTISAAYGKNDDSARYYFRKGIAEKNANRFQTASQAFERAIQFNGSFIDAYIENAYSWLQMRKTDRAKACFTKVIELDPTNDIAKKELMELYFNYRQYAKAIEMSNSCTGCENADRIRGISHYQQEDYPAAEKALKSALTRNPRDAEATYTLARAYLDMEEYRKALPYYEKAISLDKANNKWQYELGLLHYTLNDFKKAMAMFMQAAENGYAQTNDFNENLGYAALYSGEYDKGEQLLLGIWKRKPGNKDIIRDLAEILYKQKQYDRSLQYCQQLLELDDKDGKALYQAGLNFQKKGQKDRGQQMCDKAIEMDPSLENLRRKKEMAGM